MAQRTKDRSEIAFSRFGLGRRADQEAMRGDDAYGRLLHEITAGRVAVPEGLPAGPDIFSEIWAWQDRNEGKLQPPGTDPNPIPVRFLAELDARYNGAMLQAETGLGERLTLFWANHFAVSRDKIGPVAASAGAFEREAIRPHVFGRFTDMLVAAETHPTMIWYLDNEQSVGPDAAGNRNGKRGLNENLAREIMELHTLGVRSGYSQADVTAFARVITGWTVKRGDDQPGDKVGAFAFNPKTHQPGDQRIMGRTYAEAGQQQGVGVLRDLAAHPATARHIATKLARHFIADTPPPALVARLERTFLDSGGDLQAVSLALVQSPEATAAPPQKLRLPQEYLSAMQRATGRPLEAGLVNNYLTRMGQPLWLPGGPNGFSDSVAVWATAVSIEARLSIANRFAHNTGPDVDPRAFAEAVLGGQLSQITRDAIAHAETRPQGVAIAFLSPEFMRR